MKETEKKTVKIAARICNQTIFIEENDSYSHMTKCTGYLKNNKDLRIPVLIGTDRAGWLSSCEYEDRTGVGFYYEDRRFLVKDITIYPVMQKLYELYNGAIAFISDMTDNFIPSDFDCSYFSDDADDDEDDELELIDLCVKISEEDEIDEIAALNG